VAIKVPSRNFNARLREELLNGEIFYTLREAQIVIESWRRHYNTIRPHASIGYSFVPAGRRSSHALQVARTDCSACSRFGNSF